MSDLIYLSGPMTGYKEHNLPLFFEVAREMELAGYKVLNPATNDSDDLSESVALAGRHTWHDYLRRDITHLMTCGSVVVLPGWRKSKGACLEVSIARSLGMPVRRFDREAKEVKPLYEIIGISGYARAGKDTIAEILVDEYGFQRVAFADALRSALCSLDPWIDTRRLSKMFSDGWQWDELKTEFAEVRRLLQLMGTEVGRNLVGNDVWVNVLFDSLEDGGKYVIPDTRFPNEADAIEKWEGQVWRVRRPGVAPVNAHTSETALDHIDFPVKILNDGTIGKLSSTVRSIMSPEFIA